MVHQFDDIAFYASDLDYRIIIKKNVIKHITQYLQSSPWKKEAGGQLFGDFEGDKFVISIATGPRKTDFRSRFGYKPDTKEELLEIKQYQEMGKWFLGDWHTHPQKTPRPSSIDIKTAQKSYAKSHTILPGFLLLIAGRSSSNFYVGLVQDSQIIQLNQEA